ncbi:interleukin-1 receptor-associated kinase-like 2 [Ambystoma mexicanum]|uniref:interleukin-1 receptor-associated kinase-like 2 n=1 Tax=Ambystoma mexicanum TaxID=8296 RepID=UPI0037E7FFE1
MANSAPAQGRLLLDLPARVLEEFCRNMDCLSDHDWMLFASHVIGDQTALRRIKSMEKMGVSVTRELMWWWGQRAATVHELLVLLEELELYKARDVILDRCNWSCSEGPQSRASSNSPRNRKGLDSPAIKNHKSKEEGPRVSAEPDSTYPERIQLRLPDPPALPEFLMRSLQSRCDSDPLSLEQEKTHVSSPQQESSPVHPGCSLLWTCEEVKRATNDFNLENKISTGEFADVYKGQKGEQDYAIKKVKENLQCSRQKCMEMFFHSEVQIYFRCSHENILKLLGCCVEDGFLCLVYQHMFNQSLDKALDPQNNSVPLTWEKRVAISLGLLQAVLHLHEVGVLHGNIKSSNVFLDEYFTPKLGHSGVRFHTKTDYTRTTTKMLTACQAYLPEEYIRSGQLTAAVDIFGCGIVLAELLTDRKAMEEGKRTVYLKDLILEEIQKAKEIQRSERKSVSESASDVLPTKEIVAQYLSKSAGQLPEEAAVYFATAVCQCLRKKKPVISEIYSLMGKVESQRQHPQKLNIGSIPALQRNGRLFNYPVETDDESILSEYSARAQPSLMPISPAALPFQHHRVFKTSPGTPCESDESEIFQHYPAPGTRACFPPANEFMSPDSNTTLESQRDVQADGVCTTGGSGARPLENESYPCSSSHTLEEMGAFKPETVKKNAAKEKLMEKIALYEEGQINSSELFSS